MITHELKSGDKVTYLAFPGADYEHGIVKSVHTKEQCFVVFKCGGDWENYNNYAAALTDIRSLEHGWL